MSTQLRVMTAMLLAVLVLALNASIGGANRSIEISGGPTVQTEGRVQFIGTENEPAREITCDVTFLRTITRSIPKMAGTLFGKITGIRIDRGERTRSPHCRHGTFVRELHDLVPLSCTHSEAGTGILTYDCSRAEARQWKLIYDSFQGTLPGIEGINYHIQGTQWRWTLLEPFGGTIECLYEGSSFGLLAIRQPERTITRGTAVKERTGLTRTRGSGLCAARASHEGTLTLRPTLTIALDRRGPGRLSANPDRVVFRREEGRTTARVTLENSSPAGEEELRTTGFLLEGPWELNAGSCMARRYAPGGVDRCDVTVTFTGRDPNRESIAISYRDERMDEALIVIVDMR